MPSQIGEKDAKYCPCHCGKGRALEQCMTSKRNFDKKLEYGEIILQNDGACNVYERAYPNHNDNQEGQVMMVSA